MCLIKNRPSPRTDEDIQQDNHISSCKDCSRKLEILLFSKTDESDVCTEQNNFPQHPLKPTHECEDSHIVDEISSDDRLILESTTETSKAICLHYSHAGKSTNDRFRWMCLLLAIAVIMVIMIKLLIGFLICEEKIERGVSVTAKQSVKYNQRAMLNLIKEERIRRMLSESMLRFEERINSIMKDIDKREAEYIRHMFLMILLFLLMENINEIIKSIKARCRKYPCINSILYLLWQSGDVEANPGPPANSITYRNWLYDVCSVVRKATVGVSPYCKMKNIWKQQPDNWPPGELYFDPRNSNNSIHKVETFLQILLHCFDHTRQLPRDIKSEIDAWNSNKSKDNSQLLNLYMRRVCYRSIAQSMTILQSHISVDEVLEFKLDNSNIIKVSQQPATDQFVIAQTLFRADTTRKIASFLCRIFYGKDPEQKCDHIWKETPVGWPTDCRFYHPYNGGKRCAENEDTRLARGLITLCENYSIFLPQPYKDMIKVWLDDDQALLSKLIAKQTAEIRIKNALRKLQERGLLRDSQVVKQLKELGLSVQSTTGIKITKSQKRKTANATTTSNVKRTRIQYDQEERLDATLKELLPECSIAELYDKSDSHLLDMLSPKLSNGFLDDETDDIQCQ